MSFYNGLNITQLAMETVDRRGGGEDAFEGNLTLVQVVSEVVQELETQREMSEAEYEQFLADVWVGVVLTLMVLSCVCCMCSCLLYHKFQQWKRRVLEQRAAASRDPDFRGDVESLPSYTLVSGLPSYEEALEQLKQVQAIHRGVDHVVMFDCGKQVEADNSTSQIVADGTTTTTTTTPNSLTQNNSHYVQNNQVTRLSVAELLQIYKIQQQQQPIQQQQQQPQQQQIVGTIHLHRGIVKI